MMSKKSWLAIQLEKTKKQLDAIPKWKMKLIRREVNYITEKRNNGN